MKTTFQDLKDLIKLQLAEAAALAPSSPHAISALWMETFLFLDYVRELPDDQLRLIRIHTSLMTATPWWTWMHHPLRFDATEAQLEQTSLVTLYRTLTAGVPERYWCTEPAADKLLLLLGLVYHDRLINDEVLRWQRLVTSFYNAGLLETAPGQPRKILLEIGAGYGGLAHQIARALDTNFTYVILDLPEMLFFAATFLRLNHPSRRLYLYDPRTFSPANLDEIIATHDFVLLPNYILDRLNDFPAIHVAINIMSMQEMKEPQVRAYTSWLSHRLQGWFYSENFKRHPYNAELSTNLDEIFADYFTAQPATWADASRPGHTPDIWYLHQYLLTSKTSPAPYQPIRPLLYRADFTAMDTLPLATPPAPALLVEPPAPPPPTLATRFLVTPWAILLYGIRRMVRRFMALLNWLIAQTGQ